MARNIVIDKDYIYSNEGKNSIERFKYILSKSPFIKKNNSFTKIKPTYYKDYFHKNDESSDSSSSYHEDIFSNNYKIKLMKLLKDQKEKYFNLRPLCAEKRIQLTKNNKKLKNESNEEIKLYNDKEKYQYHIYHHTEITRFLKLLNEKKKFFDPSAASYKPKLDFIYKKILYSPNFKKMVGRYDQEIISKNVEKILKIKFEELKKYYNEKQELQKKKQKQKKLEMMNKIKQNQLNNNIFIEFNRTKEKLQTNSKLKNKKTNNNIECYLNKTNNSEKLNKSFNKSNASFKTKIEENSCGGVEKHSLFSNGIPKTIAGKISNKNIKKEKNIGKIVDNFLSDEYIPLNKREENKYSNTLSNNIYKSHNKLNSEDLTNNIPYSFQKLYENNTYKNKIRLTKQSKTKVDKKINGINFDMMLPRQSIEDILKIKKNTYPSIDPNYKYIYPRCITKVIYKSPYTESNSKIQHNFRGIGEDYTYDANKCYHLYNNHKNPKYFSFTKMLGSNIDNEFNLPSYMVKQFDKKSMYTMTEQSLYSNNFRNTQTTGDYSSFKGKKSFNVKLNLNNLINKAETKEAKDNIIYTVKYLSPESTYYNNKLFISNSLLPEYYRLNLDNLENDPIKMYKGGIDGITMKTIKSKKYIMSLFNDYEKKLFFPNFK